MMKKVRQIILESLKEVGYGDHAEEFLQYSPDEVVEAATKGFEVFLQQKEKECSVNPNLSELCIKTLLEDLKTEK